MPCNECGSCRYSSASTARVEVWITSSGFTDECKPDMEMLYSGLTYQSPGLWSTSDGDTTVTAKSKCVSGAWTWSKSAEQNARAGGPVGACDLPPPTSITENEIRSDCGGFHMVVTTLYPGKWVQEETKITVENNADCE